MMPAVWKSRLRGLLQDCIASAPIEQADRIYEANRLFREACKAGDATKVAWLNDRELKALRASEAHVSAAIALLGRETGFMLSRGFNGSCLATISLPGRAEEVTAEGATLALALLAALASALLADADKDGSWPSA